MKFYFGNPINNPFEVPKGNYRGTFFRHRPAKKAFCSCPLEQQQRFDFSLIDEDGRDEGYIASATLCTNPRCQSQRHGMKSFLEEWHGDRIYDYLDSDQNIDLDLLLNKKADVQIIEKQGAKHAHPYSKLEHAFPPGTLIEN